MDAQPSEHAATGVHLKITKSSWVPLTSCSPSRVPLPSKVSGLKERKKKVTKTCNFHVIIIIIFFLPYGMWDLDSLTRGQTLSPAVERRVLTTGLPWKSHFVTLSHTHTHACTQHLGDIHRCRGSSWSLQNPPQQ